VGWAKIRAQFQMERLGEGHGGPLGQVEGAFKGAMIFLVMDYVALAFIIYLPWLSLFLPNMMVK